MRVGDGGFAAEHERGGRPVAETSGAGPLWPVSVKGVVVRDGRVLLCANNRGEWELPGGRLEPGETPEQCVAREITEETGWPVEVGPLLDTWVYRPRPHRRVLIVTYGCTTTATGAAVCSHEHREVGLVSSEELPALRMPDGYRQSIRRWLAHPDRPNG